MHLAGSSTAPFGFPGQVVFALSARAQSPSALDRYCRLCAVQWFSQILHRRKRRLLRSEGHFDSRVPIQFTSSQLILGEFHPIYLSASLLQDPQCRTAKLTALTTGIYDAALDPAMAGRARIHLDSPAGRWAGCWRRTPQARRDRIFRPASTTITFSFTKIPIRSSAPSRTRPAGAHRWRRRGSLRADPPVPDLVPYDEFRRGAIEMGRAPGLGGCRDGRAVPHDDLLRLLSASPAAGRAALVDPEMRRRRLGASSRTHAPRRIDLPHDRNQGGADRDLR